jgi:hypothetical protein
MAELQFLQAEVGPIFAYRTQSLLMLYNVSYIDKIV